MTNLQLIIARKIIETESINSAAVIYLGDTSSEKVKHYLAEMRKCAKSCIALQDPQLRGLLKTLRKTRVFQKVVAALPTKHFSSVYLANLKKSSIHHILSLISWDSLMTFDDGIGNLNKKSTIYRIPKINKWQKFTHKICGKTIHAEDILEQTQLHYTIFKGKDNLIKKTKFIELSIPVKETLPEEKNDGNKEIKIFLGTVYRQLTRVNADTDALILSVAKFLDENNIDFYIPHPRDEKKYFKNVKVISSNRIAEEEIIDFINLGYKVKLFGFANTTQFNLASLDKIENYAVNSQYLEDTYSYIYQELCDSNFRVVTI